MFDLEVRLHLGSCSSCQQGTLRQSSGHIRQYTLEASSAAVTKSRLAAALGGFKAGEKPQATTKVAIAKDTPTAPPILLTTACSTVLQVPSLVTCFLLRPA